MVTILDANGEPLRREQLREPQTAHLWSLQREFAQHPSRGLTPSKLARILEDAEQGDLVSQYELFEDMEEKDAHLAAEMGKRRRAAVGLDWTIEPPKAAKRSERKAAATIADWLSEIPDMDDFLFDVTDAIGKGFSCCEIEWHMRDGVWLPKTLSYRPQTWFRLRRGYRQEIRLRDISAEGQVLNPFGWVTHTHKAKSGYIERANLFRVLAWPYLFKNYSVADLAEFLEIYGIPLRLGKYPSSASEQEKVTLLRAVTNIGHNAAGIIPESMAIEFEKAAEGDPASFELMIDWCERSTSKAILGATLTSQADRGSNTNALGNVHNDVRMDLRDSDAGQIALTLTRDLIYPIAALNGLASTMRECPRWVFDTQEPEDLKLYSESLPKLADAGVQIPVAWVSERLRIPAPVDDEPVLKAKAPAAAPGTVPFETVALKAQTAASTITDNLAATLDAESEAEMTRWIESLREELEHAPTLEEFRDRLIDRYGDLPIDKFQAILAQAFLAADLAGRVSTNLGSDPKTGV